MFKVEALLVSKFHAAELLYAIFLKIAAKLHFFVQICNYWVYFSGQPHQNFVNSLRIAQIRGML